MFSLLKQRHMKWLGHICRKVGGRIPKDLLYGELVTGKRQTGHLQLWYRNTCKLDLKALGINTDTWKAAAADRSTWKHTRQRKKGHTGRHGSMLTDRPPPSFAESATEIATPALVSLATPNDAEIDKRSQRCTTP